FFRARTYTGYPIGILLFQAFCDMTDTRDSIPATAAKIEISLSRLPQLFNSLDPSPFLERDLDRDAEDYIVGSAEEAPRQHPLALVIHLPADQKRTSLQPASMSAFDPKRTWPGTSSVRILTVLSALIHHAGSRREFRRALEQRFAPVRLFPTQEVLP